MKTELRAAPHSQIAGAIVFEVWYAGELIGTVAGADGPGVRVLSKYPKEAVERDGLVLDVAIHAGPRNRGWGR